MNLWFPSSPAAILALLRQHEPVPNKTVQRQLVLRWTLTLGMLLLLPLSITMALTPEWFVAISGWIIGALGCVGLLAVCIGALARQRHGFNRQWGLAPLNEAEVEELTEISSRFPEIQAIVDGWLDRWIRARSTLRGTDLMLLRKAVSAYAQASAEQEPTVVPLI